MKCSAKSLQVLIQSGFSNDWTSAMPSAIATLITLLPMELVLTLRFDSQGCATTCSRAMHHCPISRKLGPWDYRELIETDSLFDVNNYMGDSCKTIIRRAKRDLSSFSSTTRSTVLTLITFPFLFHVCSLRFFITAKRFILLYLTLFCVRAEQFLPYFTLWNQIFPHLFAHYFLRDQILKVGT